MRKLDDLCTLKDKVLAHVLQLKKLGVLVEPGVLPVNGDTKRLSRPPFVVET